ncbi:unnamed protein product [Adineta ricciae]|uniref:Peptidase M12B domain-containing protein n=1 Tax=Adineta ricciae TaxID=249248 RepID=A0A815E9Y4_ADIRI|nr:unnamed protein product [Adineta ricciae]CAF1456755.1 unnamed protein product [Adineta ricciae]
MMKITFFLTICTFSCFNGFSIDRVKRATVEELKILIQSKGGLAFDTTVVPEATEPRKFACLFVFDKEASNELQNNYELGNFYATQLADFASRYTAHANILITNAGVEMWSEKDQISFDVDNTAYSPMQLFLPRFQTYLANTKKELFGTVYTVGVLISNKGSPLVGGGYSQGPANTTWGASIINYRFYPWVIAGLLAHELAHTLSVIHPFELEYLCDDCKKLPFCPSVTSRPIPAECKCEGEPYPAKQCLMTFQFGFASENAPRYTSCDIQMMNFFASNASCY